MARYSIKSGMGGAAVAATFKTNLSLISSANVRPKIYEFLMGATGLSADNAMEFSIDRETSMTAGTNNTTVTPNPLDPGDPAASQTSSGGAWTTEPTVGANLAGFGFNQRQMVRWVAKDGSELVSPATANAGIGIRVLSATYIGEFKSTILYIE